jgi:Caspase domain/Glucodextranase, domain B
MKRFLVIILTLAVVFPAVAQKKSKLVIPYLAVNDVPTVEWISYPKDTTLVSQNVQTLTSKVHSRLPLVSVSLQLNNVMVDQLGVNDFSKPIAENVYEQLLEKSLTMRTGYNTITLTSKNNKALTSVITKVVKVDPSLISVLRDEKDLAGPMVYISNPPNIREEYVKVFEDMVKISGTVIDESGVQSLVINNQEVPVKTSGAFSMMLPLNSGENHIKIEVKDKNQNITLKKIVIDRKNTDGTTFDAGKTKNFLVVIGINDYQSWPHLNNSFKDANDVYETLISKYNFERENATLITNAQATRNTLYNTLRSHIEKVSSNDNLLIYFSGHGYFDKLLNEGYWIPVEAQKNDFSGYIPNTQILRIIENINSQHTLLVADACFSGSLFSTTSRGYAENVEKYKSRWGIASGRLEEVSDGEPGTNSPFASALIEYLAQNKDQKIAVSDMVQYLKKRVTETSGQTPVGNPLKGVGDEGGEFVFYKRQ